MVFQARDLGLGLTQVGLERQPQVGRLGGFRHFGQSLGELVFRAVQVLEQMHVKVLQGVEFFA